MTRCVLAEDTSEAGDALCPSAVIPGARACWAPPLARLLRLDPAAGSTARAVALRPEPPGEARAPLVSHLTAWLAGQRQLPALCPRFMLKYQPAQVSTWP